MRKNDRDRQYRDFCKSTCDMETPPRSIPPDPVPTGNWKVATWRVAHSVMGKGVCVWGGGGGLVGLKGPGGGGGGGRLG